VKLSYNSPLILSFALLAATIFLFDHYLSTKNITALYFSSPSTFNVNSTLDYLRSFSYIFGHASWDHLAGNLMLILLIGPVLEEKYKFLSLGLMIMITAAATSFLNMALFHSSLMGASGIAFMLIILSSFTNARADSVPLTFVLITLLFLTREIADAFLVKDSVSQFGHVFGGVLGGVFGFIFSKAKRTS